MDTIKTYLTNNVEGLNKLLTANEKQLVELNEKIEQLKKTNEFVINLLQEIAQLTKKEEETK